MHANHFLGKRPQPPKPGGQGISSVALLDQLAPVGSAFANYVMARRCSGGRCGCGCSPIAKAGCKAAGEVVAAAEEKNDVETPDEVEQAFKVPDASKVKLTEVATVLLRNGTFSEVSGAEVASVHAALEAAATSGAIPLPCFQFDHVSGAQFVSCYARLPIESLTFRQLELLPLWCDVAYELPMVASDLGPAMPYESVVKALTDVTVSKSLSVGMGGAASPRVAQQTCLQST